MFYLYDLATYTKNYGTLSSAYDDLDDSEEDHQNKDLLRHPPSSYSWSDEEEGSSLPGGGEKQHRPPGRGRKRRHHNRQHQERLLNIDEAVQSLGMGIFQYRIALAAGMLLAADSMEVVILSYLSNIFKHNLHMMSSSSSSVVVADPTAAAENSTDTIEMVVFPAGVVGALVWGILADVVGRRPVFNASAATIAIFGVGTAFVTSYQWLLFTRLVVGFGIGGFTVPFCAFSEFLPPSQRGTNLIGVQVFCIVGALLVHLTLQQQNLQQAWRQIVVLFSIPSILAFLLGMTVVPESPRWLLAQDRPEEALAVLRVAAKANGKDPDLLFPARTILYSHEPQETRSGFLTLFSFGWLKLTSVLLTTYFGMAFLNHGTTSLAVSVFSNDHRQQDYQAVFNAGSHFLSLFLVVFLIDGFGRASTQCLAYAVGGVLCLTISLMEDCSPGAYPNLVLALTFLAHTCMLGGKCATWISTTEILATEMRTTGHGLANAVSRIGGFVSSLVITRIYSLPSVGLALFVLSLWTASSASKLPETNVKEMGVVYYPPSSLGNRERRRRAAACESSSDPRNPI